VKIENTFFNSHCIIAICIDIPEIDTGSVSGCNYHILLLYIFMMILLAYFGST